MSWSWTLLLYMKKGIHCCCPHIWSSEAMEHVHIETYPGRLQKTSTNSSLENNQSSRARADLQSRMYCRQEQITTDTEKIWRNSSCYCNRRWNKGVHLVLNSNRALFWALFKSYVFVCRKRESTKHRIIAHYYPSVHML